MANKEWNDIASADYSALSSRQKQILYKLCEGKNTSLMALELNITRNTVKYHVKGLFRTLRVHTRTMAVRKALENGWWDG